jgi:hypothetical protein
MTTNEKFIGNNHIIKWNYKIDCSKKAIKINQESMAFVTQNKIIFDNISFNSINQNKVKSPDFIKDKIKAVYMNSNLCSLFVYDNGTIYFRGTEEKIGKIL